MTSVRRQGLDKERDARGQMLTELFRDARAEASIYCQAKHRNCVSKSAADKNPL